LEKQNKILIGLGIAVVGYLLLKPKASNKPIPANKLTTNTIDAQTNTISTSTTTETTTQSSIVEKINIKNRPDIKSPEPYIITDEERLENSFTPKEFKNELSIDAFGNLNNFMTASDVYYIGGWAGGKGRPSDYLFTSTGIISS
jgi:hypothetical protein